MYRLFYYPANASFAPHVLLEEVWAPFELVLVDRAAGAQKDPAYLHLNPNGRIPTLVDGDLVLFEAAAIRLHIADQHREAGFAVLERELEQGAYLLGESYSACDVYLFMLCTRRLPIVLLAGLLCQGCNTAYHARVGRDTAGSTTHEETIQHCLSSLGFADVSRKGTWPEHIRNEPGLVAIWVRPGGGFGSSTAETTASRRREPAQWRVTFISRNSPVGAEILSGAFVACLPVHTPAIAVDTDSEGFIDLR